MSKWTVRISPGGLLTESHISLVELNSWGQFQFPYADSHIMFREEFWLQELWLQEYLCKIAFLVAF